MKKWTVLALLSGAMFIIVIDTTMMNVSISALVEDLNTTVSGIQAAISIYALVMASFMLIGGKLADIGGKKRMFVIGLCIYGVGHNNRLVQPDFGHADHRMVDSGRFGRGPDDAQHPDPAPRRL